MGMLNKKKLHRVLLLNALLFVSKAGNTQQLGIDNYVIVISVDGLRPDFYLNDTWVCPNLKKIKENGLYSEGMTSVFPSITYPSHAAMVSGAFPSRTGIKFNKKKESAEWYWRLSEIQLPTIWSLAKLNGISTAAVQWPTSVTDEITWNIPEIWDTLHMEDRISVARNYSTPGLVEEVERECTGKLDSSNMNEHFLTLDENVQKISKYILGKYKPKLIGFHLTGLDANQHEFGLRHSNVQKALSVIDSLIGDFKEFVDKLPIANNYTLIIVGDHGFSEMSEAIRPNNFLNGLSCNFYGSGGSTFLYSDNTNDRFEVIRKVQKRLDNLSPSIKNKFRVVSRTELDSYGADSSAILALAAFPGVVFLNSIGDKTIDSITGGHHGYDPLFQAMKTGFLATGLFIRPGRLEREIRVVDIAPLLAYLLGLSPVFPDGKLIREILYTN